MINAIFTRLCVRICLFILSDKLAFTESESEQTSLAQNDRRSVSQGFNAGDMQNRGAYGFGSTREPSQIRYAGFERN